MVPLSARIFSVRLLTVAAQRSHRCGRAGMMAQVMFGVARRAGRGCERVQDPSTSSNSRGRAAATTV